MFIDCFTFFNELDLLEIRLETLDKLVDKFVLVEADSTFQGEPKPLVFQANAERFSKFKNKIVPLAITLTETDPWKREHEQRNAIMNGLRDCPDHTLLHIADADEILNPATFRWTGDVIGVKMDWSWYYVNLSIGQHANSVLLTLKQLREQFDSRPQKARTQGPHLKQLHCGWHLSFLGGADAVVRKLKAFAHAEFTHFAKHKHIEKAIRHSWKDGRDIFDRQREAFKLISTETLPLFLQTERSRFEHLFYEHASQ